MTETGTYEEEYAVPFIPDAQIPKFAHRRPELLLGPLPDDFLRLPSQQTSTPPSIQNPRTAASNVNSTTPTGVAYPTPAGHHYPGVNSPSVAYSYPGQIPSTRVPFLDVTIVEAVLNKNYGITKMDPYCSLRVGHSHFETKSHLGGGKRPRWNKTFNCPVEPGVDSIHVQIFDERVFNADSRIAWTLIKIPSEVLQGHSLTDTFPLSGKLGDNMEGHIKLVMSYVVRDVPQCMNYSIHNPSVPIFTPMGYPNYMPPYMYYPPPMMQPVVQAAPRPPPTISDSDIAAIQEMFPDKSCDQIKSALEVNHGNREAAITALLG